MFFSGLRLGQFSWHCTPLNPDRHSPSPSKTLLRIQQANQRELEIMISVSMIELEVAQDPWIQRGQGWSCDNSFREVVPLRDGTVEGLLDLLGSVERHIKGAGVVWQGSSSGSQ